MASLNPFKWFGTKKTVFKLEAGHVIKEAFMINGIQYYCFDDMFTMPYRRALGALKYYEEFRMRCTREFLTAHYLATKEILDSPKKNTITLIDLHKMNEQLGERLNWIVETESLYKFASVVFFDKNESPYDYEEKYCHQKIEFWKKKVPAKQFFSQMAIVKLIPYLKGLDISFQQYSEVTEKVTKFHLENLLSHISDERKRSDLMKSFGSAMATRAESSLFAEEVLSSISPSKSKS